MSQQNTTISVVVFNSVRLAVLLGSLVFVSDAYAQGKLGNIRSAARQPAPARPAPARSKPASRSKETKNESKSANLISAVANLTVSSSSTQQAAPQKKSGKLSSVRSQVRRVTPTPPRTQPQPPRNQPRHNQRPPSRNRPRSSRAVFYPRQPVCVPPPRTVVVREPVFVPQTVVVQEVAPVPVLPAQPNLVLSGPIHAGPQTVVQAPPQVIVQEPMIVSEPAVAAPVSRPQPVSSVDSIGRDWFDSTDSRLWATFGSDFDGLTTGALRMSLQARRSLGLDVNVSTWRESGTNFRDNLWIGDANLTYQVVARPRLKMKLGGGVNWLGDRFAGDAGINLTATAEVKLGDRWALVGEGDAGTLGDADFLHGRVSLHRQFDGAEWVVGAEQYDIGGAKIGSVFTGFGVRF